ncbi:hypothetical protein GQ651_07940 [Alphaproteobacteria bacterium GH1-50]|uniref:Sulfotransferase family protein n=1 Tax=Kangsaoukella pontilimi TaxID=2691042 RepID=A0A7C9MJH6_9RHOB|nr:sulfotransferase [Kangsaoukella pontilimi]MXQ07775.1 hypothetical protein [Kangsaoukella pontilimi]
MSVVFFCVGAAKAGTSWLHAQLADHPECHFRAIKELHYFDAVEAGQLDREHEKHRQEHLRVQGYAGDDPNERQEVLLRDRADWMDVLSSGRQDDAAYLAYLRGGAGAARVVGEVTPAYALLPRERLSAMATVAPDVRVLYMLRDPVERLWSHVRMIAARRDDEGRVTARRAANILRRVFRGEEDQIERRGDYARALRKLQATIPQGRLMLGVFEEMIAGGLDRLAAFLGIAPFARVVAPVHAGQPLDMTADQRQAAAAFLRPQYKAVERALGRVPDSWHWKG